MNLERIYQVILCNFQMQLSLSGPDFFNYEYPTNDLLILFVTASSKDPDISKRLHSERFPLKKWEIEQYRVYII